MIESLRAELGDKLSIHPADLESHGRDEGFPERRSPIAVVYTGGLGDIRTALAWARRYRVPVIPFGVGTSLEGQLIPQGPALSLDLSRMNRIVAIQPENFLAIVEPGLTRKALNEALRTHGLFFPVDPGADASLGGMAATNASGTTTVRYGGMRQNVLALQVVLASGEVLNLGRPVRKTSSGYDLKDLFIGSEGTLGVITRLTVRLYPISEFVHTIRVFFDSLEQAAQAAYAIIGSALPVARLELLDDATLRAVNRFLSRDYPERPALFIEFHSSTKEAIEAESRFAVELCQEVGAVDVDTARTQEERAAQWEARHQAYPAFINTFAGSAFLVTDGVVPISLMPDLVSVAQRLLRESGLNGSIVGHIGDGNFHTVVAVAPEEYNRAEKYAEALTHHVLELGGSVTGEHGVGLRKQKYMALEHAEAAAWMSRIKALFDPNGILNPGKIV